MLPDHLADDVLNEYLDEVLDPVRRAEVEAHLDLCPACATKLEGLRALFATIQSLPESPLTRDLSTLVAAALRARRSAPLLSTPLRLLFAAQALIAIVLFGVALPFTAQSRPPGDVSRLAEQAAAAIASVSAEWSASVHSTQSLATEALAALNSLTMPSLPLAGLSLCFAAVTLLWLVGNGLLLSRSVQIQRRSVQ